MVNKMNELFEKGYFFEDKVFDEYRYDKKAVLHAMTQDENAYRSIGQSLKFDKDFLLKCIKINPYMLSYAIDTFKQDKDVVLATVGLKGDAIVFAHHTLKDNQDVAIVALQNGANLNHFHHNLKNNPYVIHEALKQDEKQLIHASEYYRNLLGHKQPLKNIEKFFEDLKLSRQNAYEVVFDTYKKLGIVNYQVVNQRSDDKEFIISCLNSNIPVSNYIDRKLYMDRDVVMAVVKNDAFDYLHVIGMNGRLKNDIPLFMAAINSCKGQENLNIYMSGDDIKGNKELALLALKANPLNCKDFPDHIVNDIDVVKQVLSSTLALSAKYRFLQNLNNDHKNNLELFEIFPCTAFNEQWQNNKAMVMKCVDHFGIQATGAMVGTSLKHDKDIAMKMASNGVELYHWGCMANNRDVLCAFLDKTEIFYPSDVEKVGKLIYEKDIRDLILNLAPNSEKYLPDNLKQTPVVENEVEVKPEKKIVKLKL